MMQLKIGHISEGIAGHDGQALGVIKSLSDSGIDLNVIPINVAWKLHSLRSVLRFFSRKLSKYPNSFTTKLILCCYKFSKPDAIDIFISSGANLAPLNLSLAKIYGSKNIHLSSVRDWSVADFTAYITTKKISSLKNNLSPDIVPNLFDPDKCEKAGKDFLFQNQLQNKSFALLVMGGDGIGYSYKREEWQAMIKNFSEYCALNNSLPLFITSRRTPKEIEEEINQNYDTSFSVLFHSEQKRGSFSHLLYIAEHIFVTEDSSTMLSEVISSGKKAISIYPANIAAPIKYKEIIEKYENLRFIERCNIGEIHISQHNQEKNIKDRVSVSLKEFNNSLLELLSKK
jgi:mitochondrial fission protein ELM1